MSQPTQSPFRSYHAKGGHARAASMTPAARCAAASKAAAARWNRKPEPKEPNTEAQILALIQGRWGKKSLSDMGLKIAEEAGEVAGAIGKKKEHRATVQDIRDEAGDLLISLSMLAAKLGTTLEDLRAARLSFIEKRAKARKW